MALVSCTSADYADVHEVKLLRILPACAAGAASGGWDQKCLSVVTHVLHAPGGECSPDKLTASLLHTLNLVRALHFLPANVLTIMYHVAGLHAARDRAQHNQQRLRRP